jgi:hypothetical protein
MIGGTAAFAYIRWLKDHFLILPAGCAVIGGLNLAAGRLFRPKRVESNADEEAVMEPATLDHPLLFLRSLTYWGMIMIFSAGILYSVNGSYLQPQEAAVIRPTAIAKAPVVFPALDLQGVILHGDRSSALINGHVVYVGEGIGNVKVVAIGQDQVEVELEGETNTIFLEE